MLLQWCRYSSPLFTLLLAFTIFIKNCSTIPRRGVEPWSLVLCKFKDLSRYEPKNREWFAQWLSGTNELDSIEQFFWQVSNGAYSIAGSNVFGWYTMPYTQKDVLRMVTKTATSNTMPEGTAPPLGSDTSFDYFDKVKDLCIAEALQNSITLHRQKITVVNAGTAAVYGKKNGVLLTPQLMFSSVLTHEMVHSFFIGHSYSDRMIRVFPYASVGEYDDRYDLMSTANAYMHRSNFGMSGPGLNGPHLDYLGWLPMDRVLYFGKDGRQNYTLRLSSLSVPHNMTLGWLFVMVPYDRDDPNNYYTIELRTPHQYDRGIVQPSLLIHRVWRNGDSYYSQLISQSNYYELTDKDTEWVTFLEPLAPMERLLNDDDPADRTSNNGINSSSGKGGNKNSNNTSSSSSNNGSNSLKNFQFIRVTLKRVYPTDADVHIASTFNPIHCHLGEQVLRSARWSQPYIVGLRYVCLSPKVPSPLLHQQPSPSSATAETTAEQSALELRSYNPTIGPATGENNNILIGNGLKAVKRQKRELRSIRVLNETELRRQFARRNFFSTRRTFGANACRPGLVWRALDAYDYVCVSEKRKETVQREDQFQVNRQALKAEESNAVGLGQPCAPQYLPRRAFPGDDICVTAAEKFRVFRENLQAYSTLLNVAFFNGLDTVGP